MSTLILPTAYKVIRINLQTGERVEILPQQEYLIDLLANNRLNEYCDTYGCVYILVSTPP